MVLYLQDLGLEDPYIIDAVVYFVLTSTFLVPFLIYRGSHHLALILSTIIAILQGVSLYKNIYQE